MTLCGDGLQQRPRVNLSSRSTAVANIVKNSRLMGRYYRTLIGKYYTPKVLNGIPTFDDLECSLTCISRSRTASLQRKRAFCCITNACTSCLDKINGQIRWNRTPITHFGGRSE